MNKLLKIILIVVSSLLGFLLLVSLLVSPVAKSYVNKHGKSLIGREMHVDKLRANIWTGRVRIHDLVVYEDDDTTTFFSFDTLDVSVKLRKLLRQEVFVRHITLAAPHVRIVQYDDRFNFSSIIDHFASDEETPDDTASAPWRLGFYNIRLVDGEVYYADRGRHSEWDLKNLNLRVPGVYFDGEEDTDAGLELQLADGGTLAIDASLNLDNNNFEVGVGLEQFAISNVEAYLADVMKVGRMDGKLDAHLHAVGNLSEFLQMNIDGDVRLAGVDIRGDKGEEVLRLADLAVDVNRVNIDKNIYDVKRVSINGLASHFDLYSDGNNFSRLFATGSNAQAASAEEGVETKASAEPPAAEPESAPQHNPMQLTVGQIQINDAEVTFNDFSLPDPFTFPVKRLSINAENISFAGENSAKVFAQLPNGGMAIINWKGRIDEWKQSQRLSLNIKNLHLSDLSPYTVAYLGYPFTDGTFSFTSENVINNSMLNGNNKLDLYNPEVGNKRSDVDAHVNIPLKAALFVLKDKDGKVEMEVPISGNIDSPEFNYMKLVWKTLGNLLVKVGTSPFRAVSKALGITADFEMMAFDPIQVDITSEQYDLMNKISEVANYDTTIIVTFEPQLNMAAVAKEQSLFDLKREYYLSLHPDKANASSDTSQLQRLELIDYTNIKAITVKDAGFIAYLKSNGLTSSSRPTANEVQRIAERRYPIEQCASQIRQQVALRNRIMTHYFLQQMNVNASQIVFLPLVENGKKSGFVLGSELRETE